MIRYDYWFLSIDALCCCRRGKQDNNGSLAQQHKELAELGRNLGIAAAGLGDLEHDLFPPVLSFLSCKMSSDLGLSRALPALKASASHTPNLCVVEMIGLEASKHVLSSTRPRVTLYRDPALPCGLHGWSQHCQGGGSLPITHAEWG